MTRHVTSRDGTRIGFLSQGSGPGLVLVQGAGGTAYNFDELARLLAPDFTVHSPDRRGRGLSPKPYDERHDIARDVEDVEAILAETGATQVFGLSSGAVITLEAARTLPRITRAAVYEPPFYPDGISTDGIRRLNAEIARGDLAAGLVSALLVSRTGPPAIQRIPRPVLRLLAATALAVDDRRPSPYAKIRDLVPGLRYDFHDVGGADGRLATFAEVDKPMLLLSGTKSPAFLRQSIRELQNVLPRARHVEFDGLDHSGSWNAGRGGHPDVVAPALRDFLDEA